MPLTLLGFFLLAKMAQGSDPGSSVMKQLVFYLGFSLNRIEAVIFFLLIRHSRFSVLWGFFRFSCYADTYSNSRRKQRENNQLTDSWIVPEELGEHWLL